MKKILLAVSGSISFYKAYEILSLLKKQGFGVKVLLSDGAMKFCTKASFEALCDGVLCSENESWQNEYNHIAFSKDCDLIIFAPASINSINKLAYGIADNLFIQTLIAANKPLLIAPAANTNMYLHFSTQNSLKLLKDNGAFIAQPVSKVLACGDLGVGALADINDIVDMGKRILFSTEFFKGKNILVTAGGCIEDIDKVRCISNHSSGKMGESLAKWAYFMGANVVLASSKHQSVKKLNYEIINYKSSKELKSIMDKYSDFDMLFMSAAVSDFVPEFSDKKISKKDHKDGFTLHLKLNEDLLKQVTFSGKKIGFKLENDYKQGALNAQNALQDKNLDMICLNTLEDSGLFGDNKNKMYLFDKKGSVYESEFLNKDDLAKFILDKVKFL